MVTVSIKGDDYMEIIMEALFETDIGVIIFGVFIITAILISVFSKNKPKT